MEVLFLLIYLYGSEMTYALSYDLNHGISKYPFGTSLFMAMFHIIILITAIWMFGWLIGFIVFLLHIFSITHIAITWVFSLPLLFQMMKARKNTLLIEPEKKVAIASHERKLIGLNMVVLVGFIFMLSSFFIYDFRGFLSWEYFDRSGLLFLAILSIFSIILKKIINSKLNLS